MDSQQSSGFNLTRVKHWWTLRRIIPFMTMLAGWAIIVSHYVVSMNYADSSVRQRTMDSIQSIGGHMAIMSDHLLANSQGKTLVTSVESLESLPDLQIAMVVDSAGTVTASTASEDIGTQVSSTSWYPLWASAREQIPTQLDTQRAASLSFHVYEPDDASLVAGIIDTTSPISGSRSPEKIDRARPSSSSVFVALTTTRAKAAEHRQVRLVALTSAMLVMAVTGLLWYAMNQLVSQPVSRLVDTSRALTTGHYHVSAHLRQVNELGEISTALDSLAVKAQEGEEIKVLNNRLVEIVEHSVNEVYVVDAKNYLILSANRTARAQHGLDEASLPGLYLWDLLPTIDEDALQLLLQPLQNGELAKQTLESELTQAGGLTYSVELTLQLLSSSPPPVILVIARDIQELKIKQYDLQLRNKAMDAVDVGISITDARLPGHPLVYVNQGWCKLTGYDAQELLGQPVRLLQQSDIHQPAHAMIEQAQSRGESVQVLLNSTRKDGSTYMDELFLSPIHNSEGDVTHYIGVNRDVTSLLETQRQLDNAQRLESVGLLSSGIAHDFNNLLSVIQGNLEFLMLQLEEEDQLELVRDAVGAANMGGRLTKRLLAFGRRSQLEPTVLNLNTQILEAVELLRSAVGESVTLSTSLAADLWTVFSDRSQLENTIVNLTLNARDALPEGGRILIKTANLTVQNDAETDIPGLVSGQYVCLQVTDNGCGMTEEVKVRVLEPFFSTKEPGKGTGLGLSTIYGFVRQSGGHLHIASQPDEGTTISVYFPRYELSIPESTQTVPEPEQESPPPMDEKSVTRILVVDDNDSVRKVTLRRLVALGYQTVSAADSKEAIQRLENAAKSGPGFDLVLTDIVMNTAQAGYELAQWVKDHYPQCPVMFTSAYFDRRPDDAVSGPFLQKPYSLEELREAVAACLASRER